VIHAYLGEIAYSRKQYREATTHLAKSGKLRDDPRIAEMLIESYLETGGRMQALEALKGVQPGKLSAPSQFALGLALARHDLSREAVPYFQAIAEAHPESYDAAFNLALCAMQSGEFTLAIDTLQEAVRNGHETAELDNLLAEAYAGNKQIQPAIDALRKATRLAPEDENNYLDLAALCANYDAYDVGLEVLDVGLRYHPQSDRLIFQRGVLQAMKNKFDLAEKDFQLAASLAPNKNLSYVALGVSYMQTGKLPEAIQSLRQRTKEKPNDPLLHYLLGDALIRSGAAPGDATFTEAKAELETSVRLKPDLAASQVDLGKIYIKESRWDDALQHLERARQLDPRDKTAYSQLAIVYRRTGKSQLASAALATLNQINEQERFDDQRERLRIIEQPASSQPRP
jgi:tetratricopeptide (TPR) repeat protein